MPTQIWASGTSVFRLAALYLGDQGQWTRIMDANGLTDPTILPVSGKPVSIIIPDPLPTTGTPQG